jgi:hypothetical protein
MFELTTNTNNDDGNSSPIKLMNEKSPTLTTLILGRLILNLVICLNVFHCISLYMIFPEASSTVILNNAHCGPRA